MYTTLPGVRLSASSAISAQDLHWESVSAGKETAHKKTFSKQAAYGDTKPELVNNFIKRKLIQICKVAGQAALVKNKTYIQQ